MKKTFMMLFYSNPGRIHLGGYNQAIMTQVYEKLASYLDDLPAGYPATDSGVEIEILETLFSEEEAALALHLTLLGEEARVVAFRARRGTAETADMLEVMAGKGLISGSYPTGKAPRYAISQYVIGFHEGQVDRLSEAYVRQFKRYEPHLFDKGPWTKVPQLRTIPINMSIPVTTEVMPYESAEAILRSKTHFAVRNCICRQEAQLGGEGCARPLESCLTFDDAALNDAATGKGRKISLEEALEKVDAARKAGLVLQPANSQNPIVMCTCCSCCCGVLRNIKKHPTPGEMVANPFIARYDTKACIACGKCVTVCPMGAVTLGKAIAFNPDRCIGCGLCAGVCPTQAVMMMRKTVKLPAIPKNTLATYLRLAKARGNGHVLKLAGMVVRSLFYRVIAPR
jgi:Na+-translocating ferredoxin:NAD+ oxidoreductase subunit B